MLKKFLNGLIFGSGFAIAFVVIVYIYFKFIFVSSINDRINPTSTVDEPPQIQKKYQGFLGSTGSYSGDFNHDGSILSAGPGKIVGSVKANEVPILGLKLRLALNGKVYSQWAVTDEQGQYVVNVPYSQYKIDGYDLDKVSADKVLQGYIGFPGNTSRSGVFDVGENNVGKGIDFVFIKPIQKITKREEYNENEPIIIKWEAYPNAQKYRVQVYEKKGPWSYMGNNTVFPWSDSPETTITEMDLKHYSNSFKSGYYYSFHVYAHDEKGRQISETQRQYQDYDFLVK